MDFSISDTEYSNNTLTSSRTYCILSLTNKLEAIMTIHKKKQSMNEFINGMRNELKVIRSQTSFCQELVKRQMHMERLQDCFGANSSCYKNGF